MTRAAFAALLICVPALLHAQAGLRQTLATAFAPVDHVENVADTLGCTALFRSLALMFGPESDLMAEFREREGYMASIAGQLWAAADGQAGQSPDAIFAVLVPRIDAATDAYLAHMDAVAANSDAPFDDLILDDAEFCSALYGSLRDEAG